MKNKNNKKINITEIFKKINNFPIKIKVRMITLFFILATLIVCSTIFFKTYTEYVSTPHNNGIINNIVYVNDADSDWYYYTGQNYTYTADGTLPTTEDKDIYNENTLIQTTITYDGTDLLRNQTGYISLNNGEQQSKLVYYKYYPVYNNNTSSDNTDDYIMIELIDNPYGDRPDDLAFNGWVSTYTGVVLSYNSNYYERYAKVPITYTNGIPNSLNITFNANWIPATTSFVNSSNNWSTAINSLQSAGMQEVEVITVERTISDMQGYYTLNELSYYDSCAGMYDNYGNLQDNNCVCYSYWNNCEYYVSQSGVAYEEGLTYYELNSQGYMSTANPETFNWETVTTSYTYPYSATTNMVGFYKSINLNYGDSQVGYYNSLGETLTETCNSDTCTVYELVQYSNGTFNETDTYYYLVTRDTNILVMTSNLNNNWQTNQPKPFTLTTMNNGTYYDNVVWTVNSSRNGYVKCFSDTRIEYIRINVGTSYMTNSNPTSSASQNRYFYGNFKNVKLGRGLVTDNNYATFIGAMGGNNNNGNVGSSSNLTKYKFVVESGFYSTLSLSNTSNSNSNNYNIYIQAKGIYGNDYDRVSGSNGTNDNSKLIIYLGACGSWNDNYYSENSTGIIFDLVVKSGQFGTGKYDSYSGIYVGGRMGGTHHAARRMKQEGGWIYNLIGGPLSSSDRSSLNDIYIYMTGGSVDMIIGGAGETATYGNRIIQVTGGTVNYSIFGGSNGYASSDGNGTLRGSGYIYVGGNAIIGNADNMADTLWGAEAGSVFGIGNGRNGYESIGSSDNSYIIIADNALIRQSVYGGGNYGAVGINSSSHLTETKIKIIGGTISNSVYGGGNNNGAGNSSIISTISIDMTKGIVNGSVYGGANAKGTVYGSTNINISGGTVINNVYGGGQGGYTNSSSVGTYVLRNSTVTIGDVNSNSIPNITNVYGGSAYGSVNGNSKTTTTTSSYNTLVTINKGNITNVYGGGEGSNSFIPYVEGNITVNINGGTITSVYGGNDLSGLPNDSAIDVTVNSGTITSGVYGGGNKADVKSTNVIINNGTITSIYGGGNQADVTGSTNVTINGGNITNPTDNPEVSGSGSVYGGCNITGTVASSTNVTMINGRINGNIYGGGKGGYVSSTNVGTYVLGNSSVIVGDSNTLYSPLIIGDVYGGSAYGSVNGNDMDSSNKTETYDTTVTINRGTISNIYGGGEGGSDGTNTYTPYVDGDIIVTINGGIINNSVYGGNDLSGMPSDDIIDVTMNDGTITGNIYGGGNQANVKSTNVLILGGTVSDIYGGGFSADTTGSTVITMNAGIVNSIYGGCNITGTVFESTNVSVLGGTVNNNIYGGGKGGYIDSNNIGTYVVQNSNVVIGNLSSSLIPIVNGIVYGGSAYGSVNGNDRSQTTQSDYDTNVTVNKGVISTVFGGGQGGSDGTNTYIPYVSGNITVDINGGSIGTIYGGNDLSGIPNMNISVTIDNASVNDIYGGGNQADSRTTSITVNSITEGTNINNIYGGGNAASILGDNNDITIDTNVIIHSGIISNIYGGSNSSGTVSSTKIYLANNSNINVSSIFGGNNIGGTTDKTNIDINGGTINYIYGGSYGSNATTGNSTMTINNATITSGIYGGGEQALTTGNINMMIASSTINGNISSNTNIHPESNLEYITKSNTGNIFGGGNQADVLGNITLTINDTNLSIGDIYGGGSVGKTMGEVNLNISNANLTGTNYINQEITEAEDSNGNITYSVTDNTIYTGNIYGGGKSAAVKEDVMVTILTSTIGGSVYGGGDAGTVGYKETVNGEEVLTLSNTNVAITSSEISRHVFAGGNGVSAVVYGNTSVTIDGTTTVGKVETTTVNGETVTTLTNGNVFGSGNQAATGLEVGNPFATSIVNIVGGIFAGNVYGGANTSKVFGSSDVNIGTNAVNNNNLISSNIHIYGTVFGGGEANASGSQIFDWNFISVTEGIDVLIDGAGTYDLTIGKSIFGSGNASSSGGKSYVTIKNYGTHTDSNGDGIYETFEAKRNISIQRATVVVLDNCVMELEGIADRTDEYYSTTPFTIARVNQLKIKNNTYLFLYTNTNLLKRFTSAVTDLSAGNNTDPDDGLDNNESFATVTINENTHNITRNVDNRVYLLQDENVNILVDSNGSTNGPVDGMSFFGMYVLDRNNNIVTGMYKPSITNGSSVSSSDTTVFSNGSYIRGLREANQDIKIDGFYTYYIDESSLGQTTVDLYTEYIDPVATEYSYKWVIGSPVMEYTIDLTASKYSTLGTEELQLESFASPNTKFYIMGFNFNNLNANASLTDQSNIPRIAETTDIADNTMGLVMESSNTGWITNGSTTFITDAAENNPNYTGTVIYTAENSSVIPSLIFYLYHSKNLGTSGDLGSVTISLQVETPINDISSTFVNLNIVVNLDRMIYSENEYEGAITAGKKYEMFANTTTNVTSTSSVSAYFSLYALNANPIYQTGYKHTIVANHNLPENTKITMIDYGNSAEPEYYYYVVTAQDVIDVTSQANYILYGEASYDLSKFIRMGSSSLENNYDDEVSNANYQMQLADGTYRAEEEYIFIIDYNESGITTDMTNLQVLIELRNSSDYTLIGVLDREQIVMYYNLYATSDAIIDVVGSFESDANTLYVGKNLNLSIDTNFIQQNIAGATIHDTNYFNQKLGLKITITMDQMIDGVLTEVTQNGYDLLGVYFIYNGISYYPRIDGSYRFNIAERVANVHAYMTINATNSTLASGNYHIKIESFGSSDGIYYGLVASDYYVLDMTVVNAKYGLDVSLNESANVINKETGKNLAGGTSIICRINYNSILANPSIRISLYRRDYTDIYSTNYNLVNLQDYLTTSLTTTNTTNEYLLIKNPPATSSIYLYTKPNLVTGTYKLKFSLYDRNSFIGEVSKYIFIK